MAYALAHCGNGRENAPAAAVEALDDTLAGDDVTAQAADLRARDDEEKKRIGNTALVSGRQASNGAAVDAARREGSESITIFFN